MRFLACATMFLLGFGTAVAQPKAVCDINWMPISNGIPTVGISATPVGTSGLVIYSGRILMHTPEENQKECSVRQFRLHLPLLVNQDGSNPAAGPIPVIQLTFETKDSVGGGDSLLLYGINRLVENGFSTFLIDAQTPGGYQSQDAWYMDVTVIGRPVAHREY